jgi:two-component system osmolarity sensor histidine kinase EnvZ
MDRPTEATTLRSAEPRRRSLSLFWRTFFLLALLLLGSLVAWLQIFRTLETRPQSVQNAQQLASLVNLSRASLRYSDAIARLSLIKTLADEEDLNIVPRQPRDRFLPLSATGADEDVVRELMQRLGPGTVIAASVNGQRGFWVGFSIENDAYWLQADDARLQPTHKSTWLIWLLTAGLLSLLGAAVMARILNRPLKQLSLATARLREGQFNARLLDERAATSEIRAVNIGFNRMAEQLSKIEHDRAIMLAGISHDLRTPLARLRLDTEMSVADETARAHMADDIEQLDAIINKFLDYARPPSARQERVCLQTVAQRAVYAFADDASMQFEMDIAADLQVWADPVELLRVLSNLLENARRYGRSDDQVCRIAMRASATKAWVLLGLSDHGKGVPEDMLHQLTRPFFRADESRNVSAGTGLGLAIVEAAVLRMGGGFSLSRAEHGGLCATIRLRRA